MKAQAKLARESHARSVVVPVPLILRLWLAVAWECETGMAKGWWYAG